MGWVIFFQLGYPRVGFQPPLGIQIITQPTASLHIWQIVPGSPEIARAQGGIISDLIEGELAADFTILGKSWRVFDVLTRVRVCPQMKFLTVTLGSDSLRV